jgi:hypothetical protein
VVGSNVEVLLCAWHPNPHDLPLLRQAAPPTETSIAPL